MTTVFQFACQALIAMALFFQPTPTSIDGRWLFQAVSDTRTIPLFIAEISSSPDGLSGRIISTSAPFELELKEIKEANGKLRFELLADGKALALEGTVQGKVIRGQVAGQILKGNVFVAERTTNTELKKPVQPTPEELEAFRNATQNEDPKQQIALLKAFLSAHPASPLKPAALMLLFHAYVDSKQDDETLRQAAEQAVEAAPDKSPAKNDIAFALAEAGTLLDVAEKYAREAVEQAAKGSSTQANFMDTLGVVLFKKGDVAGAEQQFVAVLSLLPRQTDVAVRLAEVRISAGNVSGALDAYAQAYTAGDKTQKQRVEDLFAKHKGSLDGLHQYLDQQYEKLGPPFDPGKYEGPQPGSPVVVELFTGAQCPPCLAADYAFDGLLTYYPRTAVIAIQYHLHIPRPDPMTNPDTLARARYYAVPSAPTAVFDGNNPKSGGGYTKMAPTAFELYRQVIETALAKRAPVELRLDIKDDEQSYRVSATVTEPVGTEPAKKPKARTLHVVLVENTVHYTGANTVHFHQNVVRKLLSGPSGAALGTPGQSREFKFTLADIQSELKEQFKQLEQDTGMNFGELDLDLTPGEMSIVAFVQENDSRSIVAAATAPLAVKSDSQTATY